ncbi:MAG: metallopeptidase family protein [Candidatus Pacebacteria bacterium]|nr:metallopeptidase family protein [Candidatus Paceibacterota bacterium]MBP9840328.1 metallopeptidase family protein [Candidatus Paceibacterota bacterium]
MDEHAFRNIVATAWLRIPDRFVGRVDNVALLIEDEPDGEVRKEEGLGEGDTLLGLYRGVPMTARGAEYGVGATLPDTITLYRLPIMEEAGHLQLVDPTLTLETAVEKAVEETLWHELAHYFGMEEDHVNKREDEGTNRYQ